MTDLDRAGLIELLDRLGDTNDATVLEAARALHRQAAESGRSWDDIIRPERDFRDVSEDEETPAPVEPDPDSAEVGRLIDRLLRKGVSDSLREDLTEMKRQIGAGTLEPDDARYVRALARRLGV
jgi:hypothetical protein